MSFENDTAKIKINIPFTLLFHLLFLTYTVNRSFSDKQGQQRDRISGLITFEHYNSRYIFKQVIKT